MLKKLMFLVFLLALAVPFMSTRQADAVVVFSNRPFLVDGMGGTCAGDLEGFKVALSFSTPSNGNYQIGVIYAQLFDYQGNNPADLVLYDDNSGIPDAALQTVGSVITQKGYVEYAFVPGDPIPLQPATTYWLVLSAVSERCVAWNDSLTMPDGIFIFNGIAQWHPGEPGWYRGWHFTNTRYVAPAIEINTEPPPPEDAQDVDVHLTDDGVVMPTQLEAGTVTFNVTNDGTTEHNFAIDGDGVSIYRVSAGLNGNVAGIQMFNTSLQPGETRIVTVELRPGIYDVYCPIEDHIRTEAHLQLTVIDGLSTVAGGGQYAKISQVRVQAPGVALYEDAGGGVVRDGAGSEIWVPNPTADDPSLDVYDVLSQVTVDGRVWVEIFVGDASNTVWIPVGGAVQILD